MDTSFHSKQTLRGITLLETLCTIAILGIVSVATMHAAFATEAVKNRILLTLEAIPEHRFVSLLLQDTLAGAHIQAPAPGEIAHEATFRMLDGSSLALSSSTHPWHALLPPLTIQDITFEHVRSDSPYTLPGYVRITIYLRGFANSSGEPYSISYYFYDSKSM